MINLKYAHFNVSILYIFGIKIVLGPQYFFLLPRDINRHLLFI